MSDITVRTVGLLLAVKGDLLRDLDPDKNCVRTSTLVDRNKWAEIEKKKRDLLAYVESGLLRLKNGK